MEYRKTHSASKRVVPNGPELERTILDTMRLISTVVGATLGPGGRPALIERQDDLPPIVTKDGVTVFKSLGFEDSVRQCVYEAYREVAVRTANEAGDGTTTSAILAEAIARRTAEYCGRHPHASPQAISRALEEALKTDVVPLIESELPVRTSLATKGKAAEGRRVLRQVAVVSANGDEELADSVMKCYDVCGDEGNVTLVESIGVRRVEVEEVEGYPMATGYDDGCGPYYSAFLREPAARRTIMSRPLWILYHGKITDMELLHDAFGNLQGQEGVWGQRAGEKDVVLVAVGYSDSVLATLAAQWRTPGGVSLMPLRVPFCPIQGGQKAFLDDLAAVVGAEVYDPVTNPLDGMTFEGAGGIAAQERTTTGEDGLVWRGATEACEVTRNRTSVFGYADPDLISLRIEELRSAMTGAASKLETEYLRERLARISGGIARLTIHDTSNGATKERRDRAEDAVCAVRGALRQGALYGGGWGLLQAAKAIHAKHDLGSPQALVLAAALAEPFRRLLGNVGLSEAEVEGHLRTVAASTKAAPVIFNALTLQVEDPRTNGVYDSVPAVLEALRSSLSIATLMGAPAAVVTYARDAELERTEASARENYQRQQVDVNELHSNAGA